MRESMLVTVDPTYSCTPIFDLFSRSSDGIRPRNAPKVQGQAHVIESFLLVSQSPTTITSKDLDNIEEAHVLFDKEDNPPDFYVVAFLVPYDVICVPTINPLPKPTPVTLVFVATDVDKSLAIFNVTPMVVAPTNLELPTMVQTFLLHHTPNACNFKPLGDYVEIARLPLTTENLCVLATKGTILGKLEGHHGIKIRT
jgi:hypothetical protein